MRTLIWTLRCAFAFWDLLRWSPLRCWQLASANAQAAREMDGDDVSQWPRPRESALEELSCWGD